MLALLHATYIQQEGGGIGGVELEDASEGGNGEVGWGSGMGK